MATLIDIIERLPYVCKEIHTMEIPCNYYKAELFKGQEAVEDGILYVVTDMDTVHTLSHKVCGCVFTFELPQECNVREYVIIDTSVSPEIQTEKIQQVIYDYIKLDHKKVEIFNCISDKNPLQKIIETTGRILGNPVSISNVATKILAHSEHTPQDPLFQKSWSTDYRDEKMLFFFRKHDFLADIIKSNLPVLYDKTEELPFRRILTKIEINNAYAGCCGVSEENTPFEWDAQLVIQAMASALQVVLSPKFDDLIPIGREAVLTQLLNSNISDENVLSGWLRSIRWKPKQYFCMCVMDGITPHMLNAGFMSLKRMADTINANAILCVQGSFLIVILNHDDAQKNMENMLQFKRMANILKATVAVSRNISELHTLGAHYNNLLRMLKWNKQLYPDKTWFEFDRYYINGILGELPDIRQLVHPGILFLQDFSEKSGIDYLQTLTAFLNCGCNITKTSQIMYLHRNSLANRITKIQEITGLNFENGQDVFNAQFSLMIIEFQKNKLL